MMKKKKMLALALLTTMLMMPIMVIVEQDADSIPEFTPTTLAIILITVSVLAIALWKKFRKRRRRRNKSQTLPELEGAKVKLVSAWKCDECEEVFYLAGRISIETKPKLFAAPPGEAATRNIIDVPCCPYCRSIRFKPIDVKVNSS